MKFGRSFSIFILLFILPSSIFAVLCPTYILKESLTEPYFVLSGSKHCDDACAVFGCKTIDFDEKVGVGCTKDFYVTCSKFASSDIDFIKSKSPNRMDYLHKTVSYVSGCGGETDGTKCLENHATRFINDIKAKVKSGTYKKGEFYWNDSNAKNGAFKLIGIIAIGWIFAAFWNY